MRKDEGVGRGGWGGKVAGVKGKGDGGRYINVIQCVCTCNNLYFLGSKAIRLIIRY